ncbi:hypothetical protein ARMGADRAFT_1066722 [Armillaria gallica]|uniref:Glycoside hydrolase family 76 protein n=1 Tax=Armillaria gallica TaxID=47427 RepID=A0A2H3CSU0_ARMGA|nr:hypothetical protein ARMGADRAFT_1066722 [Armillaria gallica]
MAEFDRLMNQTMYKDMLKNYSTLAESVGPGFLNGHCKMDCEVDCMSYQDPDFLTLAATSWASARRYTISPEQAATRTMETKQFTLASSCNSTLAGGTYANTDPNGPSLDGLASGVSALLAEATSNQTYIDAAVESATFIQSNLLTPSNIVLSSIESNSDQSSSCSVSQVKTPQGSGTFIEGLVILAGIPNNTSTESLVDGVYNIFNNGGHYIVRALASLYERNKTSSDLREYIKEYIGVQYNAVIEQARTSRKSTIYGLSWTGPPGTSFNSTHQTAALTALLSAIQLPDNPVTSETASSAKKDFAGIIAGSVVGGIAFVTALIAGALFLCKRHHQRSDSPLVADGNSPMLTPFTTTQNMAFSGISGEQHWRNQEKPARFPVVAMEGEPSSSRAADNGSVGAVGVNVRTEPMTSPGNQVAGPENPPPGDRREHTLIEELLRSLNTRISRDRWNADELPPDYHEG